MADRADIYCNAQKEWWADMVKDMPWHRGGGQVSGQHTSMHYIGTLVWHSQREFLADKLQSLLFRVIVAIIM